MLIGHSSQAELFESLAKKSRLHHGYVFYGAPGIGKFTFAKSFAGFLERGTWKIKDGDPPLQDVLFVSPLEGTIGIDTARTVRDFLFQKPVFSSYRTVIIRGAELMTNEAQNALLKIAEEPPPSSLLLLTSRDPSLLFETLVSRLHSVYFAPPGEEATAQWLQKEKGIAREKAALLARGSFGRPGIALLMAEDDEFKAYIARARKFLSTNSTGLKELIKGLANDETFQFEKLLDAILLLSSENARQHGKAWHSMVELRARAHELPLNLKIQLTNAWNLFSKN